MNAKFNVHFLTLSLSIYWLISSLCFSKFIIIRKFAFFHRDLIIRNLTSKIWNDCFIRFCYRNFWAIVIIYTNRFFVVNLFTDKIFVYQNVFDQINWILKYFERVTILTFNFQNKILVFNNFQNIQIWNVNNKHSIWIFKISHHVFAIVFINENNCLMNIIQENYVICWYLSDNNCYKDQGLPSIRLVSYVGLVLIFLSTC